MPWWHMPPSRDVAGLLLLVIMALELWAHSTFHRRHRVGGAVIWIVYGVNPILCGSASMGLPRNYRFPVPFEDAFPSGLLAVSEVEPATERQSQEDRQRGRVPRQRRDESSGSPLWQVTVTDPAAQRSREAAITVEIVCEDEPVLPEVISGVGVPVREVQLTGLTAEPRLGGQGEFRYQTYVYRAGGLRSAGAGVSSGGSGGARHGAVSGSGSAASDSGGGKSSGESGPAAAGGGR